MDKLISKERHIFIFMKNYLLSKTDRSLCIWKHSQERLN
jgi:hypothetical protein